MSAKATAAEILKVFSTIDVDGNGELDAKELVEAGFSEAQVAEVMKAVDTDGNGTLSKEELESFLKS